MGTGCCAHRLRGRRTFADVVGLIRNARLPPEKLNEDGLVDRGDRWGPEMRNEMYPRRTQRQWRREAKSHE